MTSTTQTAGTGMVSASTTTTAVATAPQYVAELSEFQTVVADIPPLVRINTHECIDAITVDLSFRIGTCCIQQRDPNS